MRPGREANSPAVPRARWVGANAGLHPPGTAWPCAAGNLSNRTGIPLLHLHGLPRTHPSTTGPHLAAHSPPHSPQSDLICRVVWKYLKSLPMFKNQEISQEKSRFLVSLKKKSEDSKKEKNQEILWSWGCVHPAVRNQGTATHLDRHRLASCLWSPSSLEWDACSVGQGRPCPWSPRPQQEHRKLLPSPVVPPFPPIRRTIIQSHNDRFAPFRSPVTWDLPPTTILAASINKTNNSRVLETI